MKRKKSGKGNIVCVVPIETRKKKKKSLILFIVPLKKGFAVAHQVFLWIFSAISFMRKPKLARRKWSSFIN